MKLEKITDCVHVYINVIIKKKNFKKFLKLIKEFEKDLNETKTVFMMHGVIVRQDLYKNAILNLFYKYTSVEYIFEFKVNPYKDEAMEERLEIFKNDLKQLDEEEDE